MKRSQKFIVVMRRVKNSVEELNTMNVDSHCISDVCMNDIQSTLRISYVCMNNIQSTLCISDEICCT